MDRITEKDLQNQVKTINEITNGMKELYRNGQKTMVKGEYAIDSAYGGHKLVWIDKEKGGQYAITSGYVPKRELFGNIRMFISGLTSNIGESM